MMIDIAILPTHIQEQILSATEPVQLVYDGKVVADVRPKPKTLLDAFMDADPRVSDIDLPIMPREVTQKIWEFD